MNHPLTLAERRRALKLIDEATRNTDPREARERGRRLLIDETKGAIERIPFELLERAWQHAFDRAERDQGVPTFVDIDAVLVAALAEYLDARTRVH